MGLEWALPRTSATSPIPTSRAEIPAGLAAVWLLVRVVGAVITVPIAEELAFRGYLLRRLLSANFDDLSTVRFTWLSFVVSSVLVGALHGRWLAGTVAGMCSAWTRYAAGPGRRRHPRPRPHQRPARRRCADTRVTGGCGDEGTEGSGQPSAERQRAESRGAEGQRAANREA